MPDRPGQGALGGLGHRLTALGGMVVEDDDLAGQAQGVGLAQAGRQGLLNLKLLVNHR